MGFLVTVIYVLLALLSPANLFPSLAQYRVELLLAVIAMLFCLPSLFDYRVWKIPQIYLLGGMFVAVFLSQVIGNHWIGGGFVAIAQFLPGAIVFHLVVLHCRTLQRMRVLVIALAGVAVFLIWQGARAYFANDVTSPFVFLQGEPGAQILRIEGLGFLHDPNEFAQFLVMTIPLLFGFWKAGRSIRNSLLILLPSAFFVWGMYLTHSRGAMVALIAVVLLTSKDRFGWFPALTAAALVCVLLLTLNFSGGREISVEAGADRLSLWSDGLQMFKQSPLFGVGYLGFADQPGVKQTAHNSFLVCAAELGLFGYCLWLGLTVFSIAGLNSFINWWKANDHTYDGPHPPEVTGTTAPGQMVLDAISPVEVDLADASRWAKAIRASLAGFLTAACFLSRAYVLTIYLILGMAVALLLLATREEEPICGRATWQLVRLTGECGIAALAFVYIWARIRPPA